LFLIPASFLIPKLLLLDFFRSLWIDVPLGSLPSVLREDLFLAVSVLLLLSLIRPTRSLTRALATAVASTLLFALLLFDARVRELWLHPIDLPLLRYAWRFRADIASGTPLFFNFASGWGMTFRRALVILTGTHVILWGMVLAWSWWARRRGAKTVATLSARKLGAGFAIWILAAVAASRLGSDYRYELHRNLVASAITQLLRPSPAASSHAALPLDQPPRAYRPDMTGARTILAQTAPFRRLVIVFLESVRWREVHGDSGLVLPNLHRMAKEGLFAMAYAPIPHSSKAYFSVLTGRYAYPGIEMRESIAKHNESYLRNLKEHLGARAYSFSSMPYAFENMKGLLLSVGIDQLYEATLPNGDARSAHSSFGSDDEPLYRTAAQVLAKETGPFVATIFPLAAHFPYEYPGKPRDEGATHAAYRQSILYCDRLLGEMLDQFKGKGLDQDTLFVIVGDHGESFNEHGLLAHNSSLFEEEITVPLLFWSSDGRLRHAEVLRGRQLDIGPTIVDLFGLEADPSMTQGTSLLRPNPTPWTYLSTFFDDLALGLVDYPDKYLFEPATQTLTHYRLDEDPHERSPRSSIENRDAIVARIQAFRHHARRQFDRER
jgi:hypothetical protein